MYKKNKKNVRQKVVCIIIECGGLFLEIVLIFLVQLRIFALVFIFYIFQIHKCA